MSHHALRRHLSMEGILDGVRPVFKEVPDPVNNRGFTLRDCLMSGLAMFHLKALPPCRPMCGSEGRMSAVPSRKPLPCWCGSCRRHVSVRTNTVMHRSRIPLRKWVVAVFLWSTSLKGVSSMKLHRDLRITQKSAWFMAHRLREAWKQGKFSMESRVEVDETFIGGKRRNMPTSRRKELTGRSAFGKTIIAGAEDRKTNAISAKVVEGTGRKTLQGFIAERVSPDATVYTDGHKSYKGIPNRHKAVKHSVSRHVNGMAHTNGLESFRSLLRKFFHGTFHHFTPKHMNGYINEFVIRHNTRRQDTIVMMGDTVGLMVGKRLTCKQLVGGLNGGKSGFRHNKIFT